MLQPLRSALQIQLDALRGEILDARVEACDAQALAPVVLSNLQLALFWHDEVELHCAQREFRNL